MYGKSRRRSGHSEAPDGTRTLLQATLSLFHDGFHAVGKTARGRCELLMLANQRFHKRRVKAAENMEDRKDRVHAPRGDPHRLILVIRRRDRPVGWLSVTRTISRAASRASSSGNSFHPDWNTGRKWLPKRWSGAARHAAIARRNTARLRSSSPNQCIKLDATEKGKLEGSS